VSTEDELLNLQSFGRPRANSNGLILIIILVIFIFGVMAYSCTGKEKQNKNPIDSPAQPLSDNEWFVGKAQGLELPSPPAPAPEQVPAKEEPVRIAKAPSQPPEKRLGGKILNSNSNQNATGSQSYPQPPGVEPQQRNIPVNQSRPDYYLQQDVELPVSDYEVKAGTAIPAQLDMAINSDLGGPAVAHITRTIYDTTTGAYALIPLGAKIYGNVSSQVDFGQTRVDVVWERIIFPNGASLAVQNMRAADKAGQTGLHHTVDNHFGRLFGGALLLSAISSGVQLSQPRRTSGFNTAPTIGETMAGALGQNLGQVGTELTRRQMDVRPTITIPIGEHFTIIVNKDMVFPGPYGDW
jgi:type IV secretory pathway VirB10-like protein